MSSNDDHQLGIVSSFSANIRLLCLPAHRADSLPCRLRICVDRPSVVLATDTHFSLFFRSVDARRPTFPTRTGQAPPHVSTPDGSLASCRVTRHIHSLVLRSSSIFADRSSPVAPPLVLAARLFPHRTRSAPLAPSQDSPIPARVPSSAACHSSPH